MDETSSNSSSDTISQPEINTAPDISPVDVIQLTLEQRLERIESLLNITV